MPVRTRRSTPHSDPQVAAQAIPSKCVRTQRSGSLPRKVEGMIYLLHYDRPLHHAQHYLGFTDDLDARTARHLNGFGGWLPAVFSELGISFTIARTWDGDRNLERKLKRRKNGRKLCPICLKEKHGGVRPHSPRTVRPG